MRRLLACFAWTFFLPALHGLRASQDTRISLAEFQRARVSPYGWPAGIDHLQRFEQLGQNRDGFPDMTEFFLAYRFLPTPCENFNY